VNDDKEENRPQFGSFRFVVVSLAAALVLSLGIALIPADPPVPPPPSRTEQARDQAFEDAMKLRAAGLRLGTDAAGSGAAATVDRVVSLLTFQARALLDPASPAAEAVADGQPSAAAPAAVPDDAAVMTASELAAALAASGSKRLDDAKTADGGMARLLAGAGTAQVAAARTLAAAAGAPDPSPAVPPLPALDPTQEPALDLQAAETACPSPAADNRTGDAAGGTAGPGHALAAVAAAEREAVYAYQAAVVRLPSEAAGPASEFLLAHQELMADAESLSRRACGALPLRQPGYVLAPGDLSDPVTALARLEAGALPLLGDAVATTDGTARAWALAALQAAAARTVHWGAEAGALPGLVLDQADLPALPAA
jgi:hypothetical protein